MVNLGCRFRQHLNATRAAEAYKESEERPRVAGGVFSQFNTVFEWFCNALMTTSAVLEGPIWRKMIENDVLISTQLF